MGDKKGREAANKKVWELESAAEGGFYVEANWSARSREFLAVSSADVVLHHWDLRHGVDIDGNLTRGWLVCWRNFGKSVPGCIEGTFCSENVFVAFFNIYKTDSLLHRFKFDTCTYFA